MLTRHGMLAVAGAGHVVFWVLFAWFSHGFLNHLAWFSGLNLHLAGDGCSMPICSHEPDDN
jgi:hypothetical protein